MIEKTSEEQFVDDMEEIFCFLDEINLRGANRDKLIFLIGKAQGNLISDEQFIKVHNIRIEKQRKIKSDIK